MQRIMEVFLNVIILICFIPRTLYGYNVQHYLLENTTRFMTKLHAYSAMSLEFDFHVEFPVSVCCPIVVITTNKDSELISNNCKNSMLTKHYEPWLKHMIFNLATWKEETSNLQCTHNSTSEVIKCDVFGIKHQAHIPKQRWAIIFYPCNKTKTMEKFHFWIEIKKEMNETICEPLLGLDFHGSAINCNKFYNYTSLPNVLGDTTQQGAARGMYLFNLYFNSENRKPCHKYLMQFLCMIFLPRCPQGQNETIKLPLKTGYFILIYFLRIR